MLHYLLRYTIVRTVYDAIPPGHRTEAVIAAAVVLVLLAVLGGGGGYGGGWYRSRYYRERVKDLKAQRKAGRFDR